MFSKPKQVLCVEPCTGLAMNEYYTVIKEYGDQVKVLDSNGSMRWYGRKRFVEMPDDIIV